MYEVLANENNLGRIVTEWYIMLDIFLYLKTKNFSFWVLRRFLNFCNYDVDKFSQCLNSKRTILNFTGFR